LNRSVDIAAIREVVPLLEYVPAAAQLRKVGCDRWRGRCPISDHAAGAFSVYRAKDGALRWYCFACGAKGDVLDLIAAVEGVPLADVIRRLGAGVQPVTDQERINRVADAWQAGRPRRLLACDAVDGCMATIGVNSWLDVALSGWLLTPGGLVAMCPEHSVDVQTAVPARRAA
jgi:hypothetical protein